MKFDDELLARAAIIVRERELAAMPRPEDIPEHVYSAELEEKIQELFRRYRNGEIKPRVARLGYPYYMRRGLAAVLICFLLTCIAAPETVMAGYQRIVEAIKTIVTEYTDWNYTTTEKTNDKFKQAKFNYLPDGFVETDNIIAEYRYFVGYKSKKGIFNFDQILITQEVNLDYMFDTENTKIESRYINFDEIRFTFKNATYSYIWLNEKYLIKGQSSLSIDETMKILENVTFK